MKVAHSKNRRPVAPDTEVAKVLREVSARNLRANVELLAFPRHYTRQRRANLEARDLLVKQARSYGYAPSLQGRFDNIVMTTHPEGDAPFILLGAHYDSVPGTPGADDNASAVAVCLECARLLKKHDAGPAMIVLFNREEDGLMGSTEFVAHLAGRPEWGIREAHILEMVGYRDRTAGSQTMPAGLPIAGARDTGDFLALLANRHSNAIAEDLLRLAACYIEEPPVAALKIYLGLERAFGHLRRSDHAPFWQAGIPSIMWTDTSEFRNPHYHLASDTPDTLDYEFMRAVTKLVLARIVSGCGSNRSCIGAMRLAPYCALHLPGLIEYALEEFIRQIGPENIEGSLHLLVNEDFPVLLGGFNLEAHQALAERRPRVDFR